MVRRLPSLNQLRAFEAAARHESVKGGADELCVTPSAVGHQIKALEEDLDTLLFHRKTRKILLTDEGRKLALRVGEALNALEDAVDQARSPEPSGLLKINVAPLFGNRWLLPRLPRFHEHYPGLQIEPVLSFDYVDLEKSEFDAALRYGVGEWQGLSTALIFQDRIGPVCAPQLVEDRALPVTADTILSLRLASSERWRDDWSAWAEAAGTAITAEQQIDTYESRAFMFDAAYSGNAVILADLKMTATDEAAGRLVRLHPLTVERPQGMHIVCVKKANPDPRLNLFVNWLRQEANAPWASNVETMIAP